LVPRGPEILVSTFSFFCQFRAPLRLQQLTAEGNEVFRFSGGKPDQFLLAKDLCDAFGATAGTVLFSQLSHGRANGRGVGL
jgi:hypothetical protein